MGFQQLYEQFHDQVQFINIYIREAHPIDGWWLGGRLTKSLVKKFEPKVSIDHYDPQTLEERRQVAGECREALKYGIRIYVDEMDDRVNKAFAAWPTRLYLVGLDGRVVYGGSLGPIIRPAKLKAAIERYLSALGNHETE